MRKKIFFIHVGKTGGSSFNKFLKKKLTGDQHCEKYLIPSSRRLSDISRLKELDYISGHLTIQDFYENKLSQDEYFLTTFLRDPLDQLISSVNWIIRIRNIGDDFFQSHPKLIRDMSQELRSADLEDSDTLINLLIKHKGLFQNNQSRYFLNESGEDPCKAIDNISVLDFIGITEHYEESLRRFKKMNDIEGPTEVQRENVNGHYRLSKETIVGNQRLFDFIRDYNSSDLLLYSNCLKNFKEG